MSVRRRGKMWLVTVEAGRDPQTGARKRLHLTAATRRDAEREEARLRHEVAQGLDLEPAKITVGQYLNRWLSAVSANLAPARSMLAGMSAGPALVRLITREAAVLARSMSYTVFSLPLEALSRLVESAA